MKKILAVSGGPDSMYMLYTMLQDEKDLVVCHVNYKKRLQADKEEAMLDDYCKKNNIKLEKLIVTKDIYEQHEDKNFQSKARTIRYDFFYNICDKYKVSEVYVAHNKDDFIETAYMQFDKSDKYLFYGIKEKQIQGKHFIIRPMLNLWKEDIKKYCDENDVPYFIDESNNTESYLRNRIRKKLTMDDKNILYKKAIDKNKENKNFREEIETNYSQWKNENFSIASFKTINKTYYHSLINNFLITNNIKVNSNKLQAIEKYILAFNNEKKIFALSKNKGLTKNEKKITIIDK